MKLSRVLDPKHLSKAVVAFVGCWLAGSPAAEGALSGVLQGQNRGTNVWTTQNLLGWRELDFVALRTFFTGGPATNQVVVVAFDHTAGTGAKKGIENLTTFTRSTNLVITSGPTLSTTNDFDIWLYTYTITITNSQPAFVEFRGRLSAGAHLFTGNSLNLRGFLNGSPIGNLGIFKPAAFPGFPDLAVTKVGAAVATTNDTIAYAINYTNKSTTTNLAIGVQVTDVLPGAVTYLPGSASGGATLVGDTLIWDLGDLRVGTNGTLTYKVTTRSNLVNGQTFNNNAQILNAQDDLNTADNSASFQTTVVVAPTPVAVDDSYSTLINTPLIVSATNGVLVNDMELSTNVLTASLFSGVTNGILAPNADGSFTYTPNLDFVGEDTFTYRASNATNTSGPAVVTINVTNTCSLTVTTTNDSGPGSLRQAILCANSVPGIDTIRFDIPGPGPHTIIPLSTLPLISDPVIIDGYTQPGASANQLPNGNNAVLQIEISGASAGTNGDGLFLSGGGSGSTIRGLVIGTGFSYGIRIASSSNNVIEGCFLGTDPTGTIARGNTLGVGIVFGGDSSSTRVGGTSPAARNVISGNSSGISIGSGANHLVQGNFIGTDATGAGALANQTGIDIFTSNNLIGGSDPTARNVIAGAGSGLGIVVTTAFSPPEGNRIQGNFIGTDVSGTLPLGLDSGIALRGFVYGTLIGGLASAPGTPPGNVISGCVQFGIDVASGQNNVIQGNLVFSNAAEGVSISSGINNAVLGNSIFANGRLGIDLVRFGLESGGVVTANDVGDIDDGPNQLQNFPVITSVVTNIGTVTIQGFLDSAPSTTFRLEFFANAVCDASGFGEGEQMLGFTNVTTGVDGTNNFTVTFNTSAISPFVTATATDPGGNTSEFSACFSPCTMDCPANIATNAAPGQCGAAVVYPAPTTNGTCGTVTCSPVSGAFFPVGVTTVMCSNTSGGSCTFTVTVLDTEPPAITIQGANPLTNECHTLFVDPGASASDNCAASMSVTTTSTVNSNTPGSYMISYVATDPSGNSTTNFRTVVVQDTTPPLITLNLVGGFATVTNECHLPFVDPGASGSDTCAASVVMTTNSTVDADATGNYLITYTATDPSGNATTNTRTVVVHDTTPPLITLNLVGGFVMVTNECHLPFADPGASGSDTCSASVLMTTNSTVNADATGNYLITYTATDPSGNATTNFRTVVVHDTTPPLITLNLVGGFATVTNECHLPFVDPGASGSDSCSASVVMTTNSTVDADATGNYLITYTATDPSGNATTNTRTVVVHDTTPPLITLNLVGGFATVTNECHLPFVDPGASGSDSCSASVLMTTNGTVDADATGNYLITYTATDPSGNATTNTRTVVVQDTTPPLITLNLVGGFATVTNECHLPFVDPGASGSDSCSASVVMTTNSTVDADATGNYLITYTATDPSGNATTNFRTVVVQDTTPPLITCPANIVTNAPPTESGVVVSFATPIPTDTCGSASATCSPASGSVFPVGTTTVICTAMDTAGNTTNCSFTVTVIAPPVADLGLTMDAAPDPVTVGSNLTYLLIVTNAGPDTATGVTVSNPLPASVTYVSSASSQGSTTVASNGLVTFDLGTLVNGATVSMTILVTPNAAGLITNTATVTAAEFDAALTNNAATNVTVAEPPITLTVGFLTGVTFNLQTGLFEQKVGLTNSGATITNATRVYVHGLPAAGNLYNASGITNGLPFVQYNLPLLSASNVVFLLEYYFANGVPVTNLTLTAEEVLPATSPSIPTNAVLVALEVGRAPLPLANLNSGRFLIEWAAIEGRTYTVQYSTNLMDWQTVVPSIVAPANRVQWLDDGPPKTESKPGVPPARFYRVFLLP